MFTQQIDAIIEKVKDAFLRGEPLPSPMFYALHECGTVFGIEPRAPLPDDMDGQAKRCVRLGRDYASSLSHPCHVVAVAQSARTVAVAQLGDSVALPVYPPGAPERLSVTWVSREDMRTPAHAKMMLGRLIEVRRGPGWTTLLTHDEATPCYAPFLYGVACGILILPMRDIEEEQPCIPS